MNSPPPRTILANRLHRRPPAWWDVRSDLLHFALINYALPKSRLEKYIPAGRFLIPEFDVNGQKLALMSAVPFVDSDFRFVRLAPWLKFRFGQTNYRVYIIDRQTGEHGVWFFGTTLGSRLVHPAQWFWRIPWHYARYQVNFDYDQLGGRYTHFAYHTTCGWASAEIEVEDTGQPVSLQAGFSSLDEQILILTHPVAGFYDRRDGRPGSYTVWHEEIKLTQARPRRLYFSLYERLGLLTRQEMQQPHSIFLCPRITFDVHLPPQTLPEVSPDWPARGTIEVQ